MLVKLILKLQTLMVTQHYVREFLFIVNGKNQILLEMQIET